MGKIGRRRWEKFIKSVVQFLVLSLMAHALVMALPFFVLEGDRHVVESKPRPIRVRIAQVERVVEKRVDEDIKPKKRGVRKSGRVERKRRSSR